MPVDPSQPLAMFFALAIAHALADFPLQGDYLARNKIRANSPDRTTWLVALVAHSLIHSGGVWWVTGSVWLAFLELVLHAWIDTKKGTGRIGLATDQLLHLACKGVYAAFLAFPDLRPVWIG